ncbi:MAG: AIR synthase-related protein, partial [Mucinivorans sp.]
LGAAYMGLQLLEREKRALKGNDGVQPQLDGYKYILGRQLHPMARIDVVESLSKEGIQPTSMIDITKGLASAALHICNRSECGVRLYLERLPIAPETFRMAEELGADPVVAALNGGDDYELMFTVPLDMHKQVAQMGGIDIVGHITTQEKGAALISPDGSEISLTSPDFTAAE